MYTRDQTMTPIPVTIHRHGFFSFTLATSSVLSAIVFFSNEIPCFSTNVGKFLLFSDVHYDRCYGTSEAASRNVHFAYGCNESNAPLFSMWNCDASKDLVRSFVASAAYVCPDPDFILFTGDATRHVNPKKYIYNAFDFLHDLLLEYFPNISHTALPPLNLGNMDLDENYLFDVTSLQPCVLGSNGSLPKSTNKWLYNLTAYFTSKFFISDIEAATFSCGGYLSREITNGLNIIVLNTVIWSYSLNTTHYHNKTYDPNFDPFGQHVWLITELTKLRNAGKRAYITGHIPPIFSAGIVETHINRYYDTISIFSDVVSGQIFGHLHSNGLFVAHQLAAEHPPILIIGSVSPINRNDPTFSIVSYDRGGSKFPLDLTSFMLDLDKEIPMFDNKNMAQFKPLFSSLLQFLEMKSFTNLEVFKLASRLLLSDEGAHHWQDWKVGPGHNSTFCNDTSCHLIESCTIACGSLRDFYESCIGNKPFSHGNQSVQCLLSQSAYNAVRDTSAKTFWEGVVISSSHIVFSLILFITAVILISKFLLTRCTKDEEKRLRHSESENETDNLIPSKG